MCVLFVLFFFAHGVSMNRSHFSPFRTKKISCTLRVVFCPHPNYVTECNIIAHQNIIWLFVTSLKAERCKVDWSTDIIHTMKEKPYTFGKSTHTQRKDDILECQRKIRNEWTRQLQKRKRVVCFSMLSLSLSPCTFAPLRKRRENSTFVTSFVARCA